MSTALSPEIAKLHAAALAEGFKDETCSHCGVLFLAHIHFVRCDYRPCPMISPNAKTLFEMWA